PVSGSGLVHHSDRGVQYVSIKYTERLAEAGLVPSGGSVGDSYDNALAETINGLYKAEVIQRRGAVAIAGGRRVRDTRMGRLVQQPPAARADRQRPASGSRSRLLRRPGGAGIHRMTQTKRPPRKPGQFTSRESTSQELSPNLGTAFEQEVASAACSLLPFHFAFRRPIFGAPP